MSEGYFYKIRPCVHDVGLHLPQKAQCDQILTGHHQEHSTGFNVQCRFVDHCIKELADNVSGTVDKTESGKQSTCCQNQEQVLEPNRLFMFILHYRVSYKGFISKY